ncbi:neurogenic protein mastermind-like [Centruroides vittatus]|uniref:neurogenic protein mastermind-like n=1 Tax=Centruroides vittatus TaxID=120091 RepID=UPI00351012A6
MEEILPSRRQTVVDRLRRRIELYRRHQEDCSPRYNQTALGLYEQQRHETLLLKQRYLESKAKKVRKNDHKTVKDTTCGDRNLLVGPKLAKRPAEILGSPVTADGLSDDLRHSSKLARNSYPDQNTIKSGNCDKESQQPSLQQQQQSQSQQSQQQQQPLPSFSVQIVQQFTSSNVSHAQHSQTIQTNVTVKALNGSVKTSGSPLATATSSVSTGSPAVSGNSSISVGTNVECKQEKDITGQCCNHTINDDMPNLDPTNDGPSRVERFSDTFSNLNFPDDSGDDVFHPDILKDLIEDVFTNPSDLLMFEDSVSSVKDNEGDKDTLTSTMMDMGKLVGSPSTSQHFTAAQIPTGQSPHSSSSIFDLGATVANNLNSQSVSTTVFPNSNNLSGLGLDFKLTEPSPAALTLKQMAEQHQNMQQKQQQQPQSQQQQQQQSQPQQTQQQQSQHHQPQSSQQQNISLGMGSPHSRSPFGSDSFSDALTSIRSNFLNNTSNNLNQVQKAGMFPTMSYNRQQGFQNSMVRPNNGMIFKQENFSSNTSVDEVHKRQTLQQQINEQKLRPNYCGSANLEQKPQLGLGGAVTYGTTRPLSHFTEPTGQNQRQSPGFLRAQGPRITPPPTLQYSSSGVPRPSSASIHLSQTQQIQINQNTQHLQVSQEQQLRLDGSKQGTTTTNQQQSGLFVNYPPNSNSVANFHMSQIQKVNFGAAQYSAENNHQTSPVRFVPQQRPPPPDYARHAGTGLAISVQQQQQHLVRDNIRGLTVASQNQRIMQTAELSRRGLNRSYQDGIQSQISLQQNAAPPHYSQQDAGPNAVTNKPIYTNALSKHQRPPNVNVGPEGLNISQRPPSLGTEWRQNFTPQHPGVGRAQTLRLPYGRPPAPQQTNYNNSNMATSLENYVANQSSIRMTGGAIRSQRPSPVTHHQTQVVPPSTHLAVSNSGRGYANQMSSPSIMTSTNQLYDTVQVPTTTAASTSENAQFSLDFLDHLDCTASDLLSLEQVIQDTGSPFPLLEDMGLLGK